MEMIVLIICSCSVLMWAATSMGVTKPERLAKRISSTIAVISFIVLLLLIFL